MKRMLLVLTVALVMVAMLLVSAMPAMAQGVAMFLPDQACSGESHNTSGHGPFFAPAHFGCVLVEGP